MFRFVPRFLRAASCAPLPARRFLRAAPLAFHLRMSLFPA